MNKITFWAITVAVAGFLFGFDTAVISGADKPIQTLWNMSPLFHGLFIMSAALWGTVLGALGGNYPCDKYGRKPTLVAIGILYLVSALGSALATDPYTFALLRFIGGMGVGISSIAVPAYISEIAPASHRGRLVAIYQFQIVFGILAAFLSNFVLSALLDFDWRMMLGIEAVPALAYLLLILKAPESPRWLILHGNDSAKAQQILTSLGETQSGRIVNEIMTENQHIRSGRLFSSAYRFPIMLAFLLAAFNQLSGINFIIYYAPRVFELAGLDTSASLLSGTGIGLINLLFTFVGIYLIDRVGRKTLMYIGSIGYIISLAVVTWAFYTAQGGMVVVFFVLTFIASHAVGQGAVIWVFIAEIFPNKVRSKGQSLGCGTHWVFASLITLFMPYFLSEYAASTVFAFFTFMMVLQLIFVFLLMPETKGKSLEALSAILTKPTKESHQ